MKNATYALGGDAIIRIDDLVAVTPTRRITSKKKYFILHYEGGNQISIKSSVAKKLRKLVIKHAELLAKN